MTGKNRLYVRRSDTITRLEMAHKKYKDGVVYTVDGNRVEIIDTCPYFLDCGEDDLDDSTATFNKQDKVSGCRGISCEECWNKQL